jgi:hypothetical protein
MTAGARDVSVAIASVPLDAGATAVFDMRPVSGAVAGAGVAVAGVGERVSHQPPTPTTATTAAAMAIRGLRSGRGLLRVRTGDGAMVVGSALADVIGVGVGVGVGEGRAGAGETGAGLTGGSTAGAEGRGRMTKSGSGTGGDMTGADGAAAVRFAEGGAGAGAGVLVRRGTMEPEKKSDWGRGAGRDAGGRAGEGGEADEGADGRGGRLWPRGKGPARNTVAGGRPHCAGLRKGSGWRLGLASSSVVMRTPAPHRARLMERFSKPDCGLI